MDGHVVDAQTSAIAAVVGAHLDDISRDLWQRLMSDVPGLQGDDLIVTMLAASVEENVATLLHMLEHGMLPKDIDAPAAAVQYARRLAQRSVPMGALVRAYRLGHARFLGWCLRELQRQSGDVDLVLAVTQRVLEISFGYIDRVSEQVVTAYLSEREHWLLTQSAVRASRVQAVLDDEDYDVEATEAALGYRLRQTHLAVVAWIPDPGQRGTALAQLNSLLNAAAAELGCRARPLFIPRDETLAWAWLPLGTSAEPSLQQLRRLVPSDGPARVAVGELATGIEGFRRTHRQARRAQDVALAAQPGTAVTAFAEIGPIALLCADIAATRSWVAATLAELTRDDEPHARLRETLLVFLTTGGSYTATADRLTLHKNTVQYRIRKAEEAVGRPISDRRADVELALRACKYLGTTMLTNPDP
jgi:hypothetical protein